MVIVLAIHLLIGFFTGIYALKRMNTSFLNIDSMDMLIWCAYCLIGVFGFIYEVRR